VALGLAFLAIRPGKPLRSLTESRMLLETVDPILRKRLAALTYVQPETVLHSIMPTVEGILQKPETVAHLSGGEANQYVQYYQAAFLAFMMKHMMGHFATISLSLEEFDDFDCVIRAVLAEQTLYRPVQLKHLPSHQVNPDVDVQTILDKIKRK
jgi:hypothetical protein